MKAPVFFVIDNLAKAGTEKQLLRLLSSLEREDIKPVLVLLNGMGEESRRLEPAGVEVHRLGVERLRSGKAIKAAFAFLRLLRENCPGTVQAYFIDSARFAVPLAFLSGYRNIIHVRNNSGYWLTGKLPLIDRVLSHLCRWHVTNNRTSYKTWIRKGVPRGKSRIIMNLMPDRIADPMPILQGKKAVIGILANLRPVKNLPLLVQVMDGLRRAGHSVELRIAGEGPERKTLEEQIDRLGLQNCCSLLGAVDDPMGFLEGIDIGVLCSWSEGTPNVLLEYAAAGRAVVCVRADWSAEFSEQGFGYVDSDFCEATEEGLMASITKLLLDPDYARSQASRLHRTTPREGLSTTEWKALYLTRQI